MIDQLRPAFKLTADGAAFAGERVLSIEITDGTGFESDELVIVLDDADPQIERPREGAKLAVALGYVETGLIDFGTYFSRNLTAKAGPAV